MKNIKTKTTLTVIVLSIILLQGCTSMIAPLAGNVISRVTGLHHSAEEEPEHAGLAKQATEQEPKPELEQEPKLELKKEPKLKQAPKPEQEKSY